MEVFYLLARLKKIKLFLGNINYADRKNVNKQKTNRNKASFYPKNLNPPILGELRKLELASYKGGWFQLLSHIPFGYW